MVPRPIKNDCGFRGSASTRERLKMSLELAVGNAVSHLPQTQA